MVGVAGYCERRREEGREGGRERVEVPKQHCCRMSRYLHYSRAEKEELSMRCHKLTEVRGAV